MGLYFVNKWLRHLIFLFGWLSLALGVIGIALPLLPTTPFVLLAGVCFAQSSPRFHRWLLANKTFGPMITNWETERYVSWQTKRRAMIMMSVTFPLSIWLIPLSWVRLMLLASWAICMIVIWLLPSTPRSQRGSKNEQ